LNHPRCTSQFLSLSRILCMFLTPIFDSCIPPLEVISWRIRNRTSVVICITRYSVAVCSLPTGGYNNAGTRGMFPVSGGFFSIRTGHPGWTGMFPIRRDYIKWDTEYPSSRCFNFDCPESHFVRQFFIQWPTTNCRTFCKPRSCWNFLHSARSVQ
jgi:hypothetical protein